MAISAKDILNRSIKVHSVELNELGEVFVRPMSSTDTKKFQKVRDPIEMVAVAALLTLCDSKGKLLFDEEQLEDLMNNMQFKELEQIAKRAMEISGLVDPK
ncbi:hypothetical protein HJ044_04895 [Vibrio parahaemolyticus]|nr:hypothetical protein [Vibrio parahaemolyticus]